MKPLTHAPFPTHLEIETTNLCQLACPFCPHHIMERKKGIMTWDVLKKTIEEASGKAKTCYMHQIGEPLIHPDQVDMIEYVHDAGIRVSISTNAMLLGPYMTKRLFDSGLDELTLAVDSLKPEVYAKLRVKGDFKRVIQNIDNCLIYAQTRAKCPVIEVQVIVTKANVSEIPAFKAKYEPMLAAIGNGSWLRIKQFSTFAGRVPDLSPEPSAPLRFTCKKLWTHIGIQWNGDLSLCCRDYNSEMIVGNIMKQTIDEVWNSDDYNKLRQHHRNENWSADDRLKMCSTC